MADISDLLQLPPMKPAEFDIEAAAFHAGRLAEAERGIRMKDAGSAETAGRIVLTD